MQQRFKLKDKNEPRVNLQHLAHYMLVQIVYIDNKYNMHRVLKIKNKKYLIRMYWALKELKYRNAKYIYKQYLTESWIKGNLILKLGRFLIKKCLDK